MCSPEAKLLARWQPPRALRLAPVEWWLRGSPRGGRSRGRNGAPGRGTFAAGARNGGRQVEGPSRKASPDGPTTGACHFSSPWSKESSLSLRTVPDHDDPPETLGAEPRDALTLLDRLPAFYRESAGFLEPLLEATDERIAELRDDIVRAEGEFPARVRRFAVEVGLSSGGLGSGGVAGGSGTRGDLRAWIAERFGGPPRLAEGIRAVATGDRWVDLRRVSRPWALLVWEQAALPVPPHDFEIPRELLPASVGVQALLVARFPSRSRLLPGERLRGGIFWQSLPPQCESACTADWARTPDAAATDRDGADARGGAEGDR